MNNKLEPSVLLSRVIVFMLASTAVVVIVLILAIVKIFPLEKTQLFFLTTPNSQNIEVKIASFMPNNDNLEILKQSFIKEYVKARNEIVIDTNFMKKKWSATNEGYVYLWSSEEIFKTFTRTAMWTAYMNDKPDVEFNCPVEFTSLKPWASSSNTYAVSFRYFCENNNRQTVKKDYTILIKIEIENKLKWSERLQNPLGMKVVEYSVETGGNDPLDFNLGYNLSGM